MNKRQIQELDQKYVLGSYSRFDFYPESGKGAVCVDCNGKEYIDFSSGIGVNSLGFCDDEWVAAVCGQAKKLAHLSNYFYTQPCVLVAEELCTKTGMSKVFFGNSGAEANECAIKAARKYSFDHYGEGRHEIITMVNSFHGRTMATVTATGQDDFHKYFYPFLGGFSYAVPDDLADFKAKATDKTCAVILEMVQGEGGVVPLNADYIHSVAEFCKSHDILLIIDEVQTGIGRTGKLFAYEHFGIHPDIVTCAKGLGGGLPIGAVLFAENCSTVLGPGDHGTTFGANPVVCAGALAVLQKITPSFLQEVVQKGTYMKEKLMAIDSVSGVDGMGMMLGITLKSKKAKDVVIQCLQEGLIALTAKQKVRFLPPLTLSYAEIDKGLEIFASVVDSKVE